MSQILQAVPDGEETSRQLEGTEEVQTKVFYIDMAMKRTQMNHDNTEISNCNHYRFIEGNGAVKVTNTKHHLAQWFWCRLSLN
jgi:hypothetical protein